MKKELLFMKFLDILLGLIILLVMIVLVFGKAPTNSEFNPKVKISLMSTDGKIIRTDIVDDSDIQTTEFSKIIVYKVDGNLITYNGIFLRERLRFSEKNPYNNIK